MPTNKTLMEINTIDVVFPSKAIIPLKINEIAIINSSFENDLPYSSLFVSPSYDSSMISLMEIFFIFSE